MRNYCCLFTIKVTNISSIFEPDNYISISRCTRLSDDYIDQNGRLVEASEIMITITEQDWEIINRTYEWDDIEFLSFRIYERNYLPRDLIMAVLHFYNGKTTLKGVADKIIEYMVSKNMLNASFGMMVTSIIRDENVYDNDEWETIKADVNSQLTGYNKNFQRFLFYAWGVWVTAHARNSLWQGILEFGEDYVAEESENKKKAIWIGGFVAAILVVVAAVLLYKKLTPDPDEFEDDLDDDEFFEDFEEELAEEAPAEEEVEDIFVDEEAEAKAE